MNKLIMGFALLAAIGFAACNNNASNQKNADPAAAMGKDTGSQMMAAADSDVAEVSPTFDKVDPKAGAAINAVVKDYLKLKNALAADNGNGAADAGKAMYEDLSKVDPSLFTADQKKVYDSAADDLKEHAEHIGKNGGNIEHQREHFAMMSEDVHSLVKAYGGGQPLYYDHCPMYKDKGAMWVSEVAAIKNPYLGGKMPTCGEIKEKIR
jgi:hypothetical protein